MGHWSRYRLCWCGGGFLCEIEQDHRTDLGQLTIVGPGTPEGPWARHLGPGEMQIQGADPRPWGARTCVSVETWCSMRCGSRNQKAWRRGTRRARRTPATPTPSVTWRTSAVQGASQPSVRTS